MSTIETTGKTIEDAVRSGLVRLGRMKDEVDIEVLEEPKSGFFGFGSKPAKVRITEKEGVPVVPAMESQPEEAEKTAAPEAAEPAVRVEAESLPQEDTVPAVPETAEAAEEAFTAEEAAAKAKAFLQEYDVRHGLDGMEKVRNLLSILPILNRAEGQTVVVKYGGSAIGAEADGDTTLQDVAALRMVGVRVVLVHGGGKHITALLNKLQVPTRFENGYRVTDEAALGTAEMALSAQVNKAIVQDLARLEVSAVGISGKDGGLITAAVKDPALGRVGSITKVDPKVLNTLLDGGFLPVVSPIALGEDGGGLNCNADDAARAVAEAMGAHKLIFLTDIGGVLIDSHNTKTAVPRMDVKRAEELIEAGLIAGGMVPKVRGCVHAVRAGVGEVSILDGRVEHALLLEMLGQRVQGTTITG